jgi:chorismate mutase
VKVVVKLDAQDLHHVWLPTADGLLKVPNVLAEQDLLEGLTLVDWVGHQHGEDLRTDQMRQATDQDGLDTLARRAGITHQAAAEKAAEESKLKKKRSKKAVSANLRQNKEDEQNYLNAPTAPQTVAMAVSAGTRLDAHAQDAAARAMKTFHDRRAS